MYTLDVCFAAECIANQCFVSWKCRTRGPEENYNEELKVGVADCFEAAIVDLEDYFGLC